jgi:hypothetical protein
MHLSWRSVATPPRQGSGHVEHASNCSPSWAEGEAPASRDGVESRSWEARGCPGQLEATADSATRARERVRGVNYFCRRADLIVAAQRGSATSPAASTRTTEGRHSYHRLLRATSRYDLTRALPARLSAWRTSATRTASRSGAKQSASQCIRSDTAHRASRAR